MKKISKMKSSKLGNSSSSISTTAGSSSTVMNGRPKVPGSTAATSAQDEVNLKVIRDLCHVESNRYCFECGQRGPTYVDVTIGSFICMQCSGLLRGLTPPHRVKSISMANFSPDEMEILKSRGNEYCRKVWLATYTSKDTQLNSTDPDRVNALKGLMSSKYEQKRYYVDPSRLPKAELSEIQGRNLRAVVNGQGPSKSPQASTHSNPSPVLNNVRSNSSPRLVNSVTLPDMKPLSALDPGLALHADLSTLSISSTSSTSSSGTSTSRPHTNHNGIHPPPIQFINNLSSSNGPSTTNGHFELLSPWDNNNSEVKGTQDDFNPNFADFEDAFSSTKEENQQRLPQKYVNGGFEPNSMQVPIKPSGDIFQNGVNGSRNGHAHESTQDKYAALKDLDSLFKQNPEAVTGTSPLQSSSGLTSSMSVPANLSSSVGQDHSNNGWFSSVSPSSTQNPFSHGNGNGWTPNWQNQNGGTNGSGLNSAHQHNTHNPFYATNNNGTGNTNGWLSASASIAGKNTTFGFSSPGPQFGTSQFQQHQHQAQLGNFGSKEGSGLKSAFNPFFAQPLAPNPNNPFL